MKQISTLLLFCFSLTNLIAQISQENPKPILNQYNQVVKNTDGSINYSKEEIQLAIESFQSPESDAVDATDAQALSLLSDANCDLLWQDAIYGTCIGRNNSLIPFDHLNDGSIELIASASSSGFGNLGYWYILKHNPTLNSYEKVYVSALYDDDISKMTLTDLGDDGTNELLISVANTLYAISLEDFSLISSVQINDISSWNGITQILYDDGDNDGVKEIIVSSDDDLVMINASTFAIEHSFMMEAGDFDIGNVDADANLEIAFTHGLVIEVNAAGVSTDEYDFRVDQDSPTGFIQLSDTDGDSFAEAIVANSWYSLVIYDVDIEAPKFEIESDLDIDALTMVDVNNDGIEEILYGDGQWGDIYCHDAATGAQLWSINNPEHGTTGIALADFDNDQNLEVVWGSGCSSSGSDYLFVHSVANQNFEWKSIHIDGPYYAVEIADVDQDGVQEIISLSYESESGYDSGILTIQNAITKEIEFQSDGVFFNQVWTGIFNFEIVDYGNDGDLDIVVAAGRTYSGKIWVVDGGSHNIEIEHEYDWQDDIDEFYALAVSDIDQDGTLEFIAGNDNKVYIINSLTFEVEWNSVTLSGFGAPKGLLVGNLDADAGEEFIFCKNYIYKYDNNTFTQSQTANNQYTAIKLYDVDNDGDQEIIAGLSTGHVQILDGATLDIITTHILSSEPIGGIEVADINGDGQVEFVITSDSKLHYMTQGGDFIASQVLGSNVGEYNGLAVNDYDNDGVPNVIVGTTISVMELDPACAQCLWFSSSIESSDPSCGNENGTIIGLSSDPTTTFSLNGTVFLDSITDLSAGIYTITSSNGDGCSDQFTAVLEDTNLAANLLSENKTCFGPDDGSATINIQEGTAPYIYNWSNSQSTETIENLAVGEYIVTITDANDCEIIESVMVAQSILQSDLDIIKPTCAGAANGVATVSITTGAGGYQYLWNQNSGTNTNSNLGGGSNQVSITDANGCISVHDFAIDSTELIIETNQLSASCNGETDGSMNVEVIEGVSSFQYQWSNGLGTSPLVNSVSNGTYFVTVVDGNECVSVDSVTVQESVLTLEAQVSNLDCFSAQNGSAVVFVTEGVPPYTYQWDNGTTSSSLTGLSSGNYFVLVQDSIGCSVIESLEITSPPEIEVDLQVTNDDPSTAELEGQIIATVTGGVPPYFYNWDNGATINQIDSLGIGTYQLLVTDGNGCITEVTVDLEMASSVNEFGNNSIKLYPNPNSGYFTLEYQNDEAIVASKVYSVTGQLVNDFLFEYDSGKDKFQIALPDLAKGSYVIMLQTKDKTFFSKFVIH